MEVKRQKYFYRENFFIFNNGITIITESTRLPSDISMSLYLNVGTRDEDSRTSGALLSLKNTYYKTVLTTNETINFGMVQMSGGKFTMDYDRESTIYSASCLSHDVVDIFSMMVDCALEPKSAVSANIGIDKNEYTHSKEEQYDSGLKMDHKIMLTAFGKSRISNNLIGDKKNILNLTTQTLQSFQINNYSPEKLIIAATGVENHNEFKDLVSEKMGHLRKNETVQREKSEYKGGEVREETESKSLEIVFGFKGEAWNSSDMLALKLLEKVYEPSSNSTNNDTFNIGKFQNEVLDKYSYIDEIGVLNFSFSDCGIFGLKVKGDATNGKEMIELLTKTMLQMKQVKEEDLNVAKNKFKLDYLIKYFYNML